MRSEDAANSGDAVAGKRRDRKEQLFLSRLVDTARHLHWTESAITGVPLDPKGEPCAWYTYAALHFLSTREVSRLHVFEYGSGYSTLWWAARAASVTSCEHNSEWYQRLSHGAPDNVTYVYEQLEYGGEYCRTFARYSTPFDIVVIDGRDRVNCCKVVLDGIGPQGVIILDNSERRRYEMARVLLAQRGFRSLDFHGFGPINSIMFRTSIYYRDGNCLAI